MLDDPNHQEAAALIDLARVLSLARPDIAAIVNDIEALTEAALQRDAPIEVELGLERAARTLRADWLRSVAAETARVLRSPTEGEIERLARSPHDAYGYERDFQPESLEERCHEFFGPIPSGWSADHIVFSSGQAALGTILLHLAEHRPDKLRVAHVGSYFETGELVKRACAPARSWADADCIIVEPVACDGHFTTHDPAAIAQTLTHARAMVVDTTLSSPTAQLSAILDAALANGALVLRLVSGLKLLQQGLELANVGIVSVFAHGAGRAASVADGLRRCRTLIGTGLRFVDAMALEAPFFLDRGRTQAYSDRIFAHNAALAQAVSARNRAFKPLCDGNVSAMAAPYCAFELEAENSVKGVEALAAGLGREAQAPGLLIERGGSFGFRGHRYEVIEPETDEPAFLRVALGAREGHSCRGVIELMAEFAAGRAF